MECDCKPGWQANNILQPELPFSSIQALRALQTTRTLHGLSTINAMCDTCLAAKGYRVE
jgi:hypothetical protein